MTGVPHDAADMAHLPYEEQVSRIESIVKKMPKEWVGAWALRCSLFLIRRLLSDRANESRMIEQLKESSMVVQQLQNQLATERVDDSYWRSIRANLLEQLHESRKVALYLQDQLAAERTDGMRWRYLRDKHSMLVANGDGIGASWDMQFSAHGGFRTIEEAVDAQMNGAFEAALLTMIETNQENPE